MLKIVTSSYEHAGHVIATLAAALMLPCCTPCSSDASTEETRLMLALTVASLRPPCASTTTTIINMITRTFDEGFHDSGDYL